MTIKVYGTPGSPSVRSTLLTVKALGLDVEFKQINILRKEHYKPEFLELNPLHTIPVLEDGDFVIYDSHAINAYLVGKYGKDDKLYPKELGKKAVIDTRLHFDCSVLFNAYLLTIAPVLNDGARILNKDKTVRISRGYTALENMLERSKFVAGDQLSIADFSIIATITTCNLLVPILPPRFPNIAEWIKRMEALPYYAEANQVGLDKYGAEMKSLLA